MTKLTLDLPEGLYRVLAIDAVIKGVTIEEMATEHIKDQVEAHFELPELYSKAIEDIYKAVPSRSRAKSGRKRKVATVP